MFAMVNKNISFLLLLFAISSFLLKGQNAPISFSAGGKIIWKDSVAAFMPGDDKSRAAYHFNDSNWEITPFNLDSGIFKEKPFTGNAWFRIKIPTRLFLQTDSMYMLHIYHTGASEIYLNGNLLKRYGKVGNNLSEEHIFFAKNEGVPLQADTSLPYQLVSVRFSNHHYFEYGSMPVYEKGFFIMITQNDDNIESKMWIIATLITFLGGILLGFSIIHLLLWLFYRSHKPNLFYSLHCFFFSLLFLQLTPLFIFSNPLSVALAIKIYLLSIPFFFFFLLRFLYALFKKEKQRYWWLLFLFTLSSSFLCYWNGESWQYFILVFFTLLYLLESVRVVFWALLRKEKSARIIGSGVLAFLGLLTLIALSFYFFGRLNISSLILIYLVFIALLGIPISMSIYLARDFAYINKNLQLQLQRAEWLANENLKSEQEKKRILENQNIELEKQVTERTAEIQAQKTLIEQKQIEILDSIRYAKRIQESILPRIKTIHKNIKKLKGK